MLRPVPPSVDVTTCSSDIFKMTQTGSHLGSGAAAQSERNVITCWLHAIMSNFHSGKQLARAAEALDMEGMPDTSGSLGAELDCVLCSCMLNILVMGP